MVNALHRNAGLQLPVPVHYNWPMVVLSLPPAILGSAAALFVVSRPTMGSLRAWAGGTLMGGGIAALHYTAMAAMRMQAMTHYSPPLVTLSALLAMGVSLAALWLAFLVRGDAAGRMWKAATILVWGAVNPAMHYTGMAATTFAGSATVLSLSHAVNILDLGIVSVTVVPIMVLAAALLASLADRLERQRVLLDELFEQAPRAVACLDVDNRVVRVNREFTRVFGYTPQEAVGRLLPELIVPGELRDEAERYTALLARGQRVEAESIRQRKDGSRLHVSMVLVPVSSRGGHIVGKLAIHSFSDISERKRAEEQLQHSFAQLRALAARLQNVREEERARAAREIHDELGQALTSIKMELASLMLDLRTDQERQSSRVDSALKLIDQTIQSVRRISTELRPVVLDALGLVPALEWAADEFETRTGTKCRLDLPQDDLAIDQERSTAVFRIFQETLTNVARHANATEVNVRLVKEDGSLTLEVHDNGKGISQEQLAAGRSLGILGMRERALLLGGELTVSGAPGKGTTVRVRLPEIPATPPENGR